MSWYDATFVQTGRSPALWALVGFLLTFALVRTITRRIHAREAARDASAGAVKDVYICAWIMAEPREKLNVYVGCAPPR